MVIKGRLKPDREEYYQQQIINAFPDCFVEAPLNLVESMTNAMSDRHVAATAIVSNASYIVTFNLKDFPKTSLANYDLDAIHPDRFLELLCDRWGDEKGSNKVAKTLPKPFSSIVLHLIGMVGIEPTTPASRKQ
jgi:hypothetical protein